MKITLLLLALAVICASTGFALAGEKHTRESMKDLPDEIRMQLRANHLLSANGRTLVLFKGMVRQRRLINPVVIIQDADGNLEWIYQPKNAELLLDTLNQRAHLLLKDCDGQSADGDSTVFFRQKVFSMELPSVKGGKDTGDKKNRRRR